MTPKQCPKCGHRRLDDGLPVTECPKCGVIYAKAKTNTNRVSLTKNGKNQQTSAVGAIFVVVFVLVFLGLLFTGNLDKFWAHLISPFDSKPTVSITGIIDIIDKPEKLLKKRKKLCAWAKREYLRDGTFWNRARRKSLCKGL